MDNNITVWYKGAALLVKKVVADKLNIQNNYQIKNEEEFWKILNANCSYGLSLSEHQIRKDKNN